MTNTPLDTKTAEAEDTAPAATGGAPETSEQRTAATRLRERVRSVLSARFVAGVALTGLLCGAAGLGYARYREAEDELARIRHDESNRSAAGQIARDYALKSLTYTYQDSDGFFKSVEDGVAPALKDKYANVADLLKTIMSEAKVESSGEILASDVTPQPDGFYQVVVSASQTTRNLQNPEPKVSPIVLQVVVHKIGNTWQISDIGPKTGSTPPKPSQPATAEERPSLEQGPVSPGKTNAPSSGSSPR